MEVARELCPLLLSTQESIGGRGSQSPEGNSRQCVTLGWVTEEGCVLLMGGREEQGQWPGWMSLSLSSCGIIISLGSICCPHCRGRIAFLGSLACMWLKRKKEMASKER